MGRDRQGGCGTKQGRADVESPALMGGKAQQLHRKNVHFDEKP